MPPLQPLFLRAGRGTRSTEGNSPDSPEPTPRHEPDGSELCCDCPCPGAEEETGHTTSPAIGQPPHDQNPPPKAGKLAIRSPSHECNSRHAKVGPAPGFPNSNPSSSDTPHRQETPSTPSDTHPLPPWPTQCEQAWTKRTRRDRNTPEPGPKPRWIGRGIFDSHCAPPHRLGSIVEPRTRPSSPCLRKNPSRANPKDSGKVGSNLGDGETG